MPLTCDARNLQEVAMSNVDQFAKVVIEAGAVAVSVRRGPRGAERLVVQTPGGLITREVPLIGDPDKDLEYVASSAREIVAGVRSLSAPPARNLSSSYSPGSTGSAER
jgi:hypothetical protein